MENSQLHLQAGFIDRLAENDVVTQRVGDGYQHNRYASGKWKTNRALPIKYRDEGFPSRAIFQYRA